MSGALPRVTAILDAVGLGPDLSRIPAAVLEAARDRGSAVHRLIEAIAYGYLDEADVTPQLAPYLDAYRKFMAESGAEFIRAEWEVVHPTWCYVGHPDQLVWLLGHRMILDFKTGMDDGVEYQLAAYVDAHNTQHPTEPAAGGAAVALRDDGTYRYREVELAPALHVWRAAVTVYHARKREAA